MLKAIKTVNQSFKFKQDGLIKERDERGDNKYINKCIQINTYSLLFSHISG